MHIVLVSPYFPPEVNAPAQRAYDHARAWVAAGHRVTVVSGTPSHPYGRPYPGYRNRTGEEVIDGIRVLRLRTFLTANRGRIRRMTAHISFLLVVRLNARRVGKADVVISTSPHFFAGLSGYPLSRALNAPWVLEIRDIWPESVVAVGVAAPGFVMSLVARLARWAYRTSDLIVSVSPGFSQHFVECGIPADKVVMVPNGVDAGLSPGQAEIEDLPELRTLRGRLIAAYIGTFGMAHGLLTVLDAAELLKDDPRIGFLMAGSGAQRDELFAAHASRSLSNVVLLDQQPRERVLQLWSVAQASIVHLRDQPLFETVIPTKLLEGMAMAKPVLLGIRGQARAILEEAQGGVSFPPEDPVALALALQNLASNPAQAKVMGYNGRRYVLANFDRGAMGARYAAALEALVTRWRGR